MIQRGLGLRTWNLNDTEGRKARDDLSRVISSRHLQYQGKCENWLLMYFRDVIEGFYFGWL